MEIKSITLAVWMVGFVYVQMRTQIKSIFAMSQEGSYNIDICLVTDTPPYLPGSMYFSYVHTDLRKHVSDFQAKNC